MNGDVHHGRGGRLASASCRSRSRLGNGGFLPLPDALASFLNRVAEGIQPDNPVVTLEPGELPLGKLADGDAEFARQVVESGQLAAEIARNVAILQPKFRSDTPRERSPATSSIMPLAKRSRRHFSIRCSSISRGQVNPSCR